MGIFEGIGFNLSSCLKAIFNKAIKEEKKMASISGPVFIKEFSKSNFQIKDLEKIAMRLGEGEKKDRIYKDMRYLKQGMNGEKNVYFELKNANIPLLCLHDVRLEMDGLSAQMDFLVLTKQYICILETKQLYGNIDLDREGNFIRVYSDKYGKDSRHGMYSPVEQNRRHVDLVKKILKDKFDISKMPVKSLIVMANPKTVIRKSYAPKEIAQQILKAENLSSTLAKWIEETEHVLKEKQVFELASFFKENHKPIAYNYDIKYKLSEDIERYEEGEHVCVLKVEGGKKEIVCGPIVSKNTL